MTYQEREAVAEMDLMDLDADDFSGYDTAFNTLPPGEEGFNISHAGGEHEVFKGLADEVGDSIGM